MHSHKQLSNEVICTLTSNEQRGQMSIHSNGLFLRLECEGSRLCGSRVLNLDTKTSEPFFHKPYFLALSKCKTNHSNELTFDLVADLLVTL